MRPNAFLASLAPWFALIVPALAQCVPQWLAGDSVPGPIQDGSSYTVRAMTLWDPDGSGPEMPLLVLGGTFSIPGIGATHLATFDPTTHRWGAFAEQPNDSVTAIAVMPNGDLAIGGYFTAVGQSAAGRVARWNGTSWTTLAGGLAMAGTLYANVTAMQAMPNGDLIVAGGFTSAGGVAAQGIARWDGSLWSPLGTGVQGVTSMALRANGHLLVGGTFAAAGGVFAPRIAEWNGNSWAALSTGMDWEVYAIVEMPNGDVVASGFFALAGGVPVQNIARWDGSTWHAMNGVDGRPRSLHLLPNGDLLAGSVETVPAGPVLGVARWDGTQWTPHAMLITGHVSSMVSAPNGDLFVGGDLTKVGSTPVNMVARWDGATWHPLTLGLDDAVRGFTNLPNGDLVAIGSFRHAVGAVVDHVGRYDGQGWSAIGTWSATNPRPTFPTCALYHPQHGLLVGNSDGLGVRRWDGTVWQPFGSNVWSGIEVLAMLPDQQVVAAGTLQLGPTARYIVRWNGSIWTAFGNGLDAPVHAVLVRGNGDLIAGGEFTASGATATARVARWDGSAWQPLGAGFDGTVRSLAESPNGELIAGGDFTSSGGTGTNGVARWNGTSWQPLGGGLVGGAAVASARALLPLANGDLLVGGSFATAGGTLVNNLARWDGTAWHEVDRGIEGTVFALTMDRRGDVMVGGDFVRVGGQESAYLARLRSPCAASAAVYGMPCSGALGPVELVADTLPWLGGTARSTCYGASPNALALDLFGCQSTQIPLFQLHPLGAPGCLLLTSVDAFRLRIPAASVGAPALLVPPVPSLLGLSVHQQVLLAEYDGSQRFTRLTGSNGLRWTVGDF
jgi:trimeric autotransporter adhesin